MITKEELISNLRESKKNYTEDQIAEIVSNFEKSQGNKSTSVSRSYIYNKVAETLGVTGLNDVRFYKIMNATAVVVRDSKNNSTSVAFSMYNPKDIKDDELKFNAVPILHQITISKDRASCLSVANNFANNVYKIKLEGLRVSELAVYEAWVTLCKNKVFPRYIRNYNLDICIYSRTHINHE